MKKSLNNFIGSKDKDSIQFDFGLNNKYFALTLIKGLKIFKTFTYNRLFNEIFKFLDTITFFSEWKGLLSSIVVIFSCLHFSTCFFIFIGKNEFQGWILRNNLQDKSFLDLYIGSIYYQMATLTTVGYGDVCPTNDLEFIYGIFILIVGTCAYSWILTYISNYIKKNNEKFLDFEEKMKVLTEIKLEYPNLGQNLYDSITRYLNYNKNKNKFNLKFILESLPSSLQNNLIIEIYKPIIMNFQFFKSFENSDFFVKIVTSLKPILSMKDDILIQEGDIIEDIIFIKNGVLTLEIIIDLNNSTESVESHLEMAGMDYKKTITHHNFTELMNLTTNTIYKSNISTQIFNHNYKKKKEIKIIDLRKNEHFGDILMILNEKSPLTVKVKSKRAELFFLQKTEATEISNRYSNIWKRIVNRSLHNMNQIKSLIRKKVFLFAEENNIEINHELKEKFLMNEKYGNYSFKKTKLKKNETKSNKIIEIIPEEDDSSINKTQTNISDLKTNQNMRDNNKKELKENLKENNIIHENPNENSIEINNNMSESNEIKEKNENNRINSININFYSTQEKDEENDSFNSGKINSEMSLNKDFSADIKSNNILMNNLDENNKLFYNDFKIQDNQDYKFSYISDEYNSNIFKLLDKRKSENNLNKNLKNEKTDIKTNDNISIESESSDKNKKSNKNKENKKIVKQNKFSDLNTSQSTSFSINSTYENINTISKFNYQKNSELREKTKNFILEQLNIENNPNVKTNIQISKTNKNINNILNIKYNINLNNNKLVSKNDSHISIPRGNKKNIINEKIKQNQKHHSMIHSIKNRSSIKKKQTKKHDSIIDSGYNFYNKINRIKTMQRNRADTFEERHDSEIKNSKLNYNKLISKNIEKNQKNLNNPQEYFEGFFNDIIFNKNHDSDLWPNEKIKKINFLDNKIHFSL